MLTMTCYHVHLFKYSSMDSGPSDLVEFDLETLEPIVNTGNIPQASDIIHEIPFPNSPSSTDDINSRNASDSDSSENKRLLRSVH